jgi:hypothetical protein
MPASLKNKNREDLDIPPRTGLNFSQAGYPGRIAEGVGVSRLPAVGKGSVNRFQRTLIAAALCAAALLLGPFSPPAPAAVKVPQWLLDEANRPLPSYPPETEAVVLLHERTTSVTPKGAFVTTSRLATRVLRKSGADAARQLTRVNSYDTKVRSMTGWVVNPSGEPRRSTMKQALFSSLAPDTLYTDISLVVLLMPEVGPGSVVGFEWEEERTPPSLEDIFEFQGRFPAIRTRYSLTVPTGWAAECLAVNWDPLGKRLDTPDPRALSFDLRDIPAITGEPYMPAEISLAGRLLIRAKPAAPDPRSFSGWTDMGAWYEALSRERRAPDEQISARAAQLAGGAADALGRIRALAEFVQKEIRYVSIQIGIGGFQPNHASEVLSKRYGDCKDKATLLSAMLASTGIESYPVIVNTDRGFVSPDSPVSLYSFNHAVLAIRLPEGVPDDGLDGLVLHPHLGRLLVFDPTMPTTPLGRLPFYLQDNTALLVAGGGGELVRLPRPAPESNLLERTGRFRITSEGDLVGEIREVRRGSSADLLRHGMQSATEAERRKYLETFLSDSLPSFSLKEYEFRNLDSAGHDLLVTYVLTAPAYARRAGGFLVLRPRVVGRKAVDLASREKGPRRHPIDLETTMLARDEFVFELAEGLAAESLPKPVDLDAGFAVYKSAAELIDGALVYKREYRLKEPLLPAARHEEALKFFLAVGAEEQQNALLRSRDERRP